MRIQRLDATFFAGTFEQKRKGFLDKMEQSMRDSSDMTDSIVVPRTIFKGYLGIMTGTTLITLSGLLNKAKNPKLFKGTMVVGLLTSLYGTWAFVRPFIIKNAKGVQTSK